MTGLGGTPNVPEPPSQRKWLTLFIALARTYRADREISEREIEEELALTLGVPPTIFKTSTWRQGLQRGVYVFLKWYGLGIRGLHATWRIQRIFYVLRESLFSDDAEMADWILANRDRFEGLGGDDDGTTLLDQ